MSLSPFRFSYGTRQGRIQPANWTPVAGSYAYVLGSDIEGLKVKLSVGDYHQIAQTGDVTAANFIRLSARLRGVEMPAGTSWRLALLVNGTEATARNLGDGRTADFTDLASNVSKLSGDQPFAIRLELAGAAGDYEVELPGVYVDAVVLDAAATRPALVNRVPEPDETQVPSDSTISLDLVDVGADGIDAAQTQIYVSGVLAYSNGIQSAFNGARASTSTPSSDTLRITLDPTTPFSSSQVVTVRVVSRTVGGAGQLDTAYSFTAQDSAPPRVVEAYSLGHSEIRIVFDEAVLQDDGAAALAPESYTLELVDGAPAVTPDVVAVESVAGNEISLSTDVEMTQGATYRLVVTGVEDLYGNPIALPYDRVLFVGYACQAPPGRDVNIWGWLPKLNRFEDETGDLRAFVSCLQEITDLLLCKIDRFVEILDPDFAPEDWLDLMLADLGNPFAFDLDVVGKRRLTQALVGIYKRKGTDQGIVDAIKFFLGIDVAVDTYAWAPLGIGYARVGVDLRFGTSRLRVKLSFKILVGQALTDEQRRQIREIATYMKDARTHLHSIVEPTIPSGPIQHWAMGRSFVGVSTILH